MHCSRCGGTLSTYSVAATGKTAVVCEACGFAGVAATHEPEQSDIESWDRAMRRFERTGQSTDETCTTGRAEGVSVPAEGSNTDIDSTAPEEAVAVTSAVRGVPDEETPDIDPAALEESVAVASALEDSADEPANRSE